MMKNKMLSIMLVLSIVCLAMAATTFGGDMNGSHTIGLGYAGLVNPTDTTYTNNDARLAPDADNITTIVIEDGYTFSSNGETRFGEKGVAATLTVEVGGILDMDSECLWNEGEVAPQKNRLNVYGTAYVQQLKMYGLANDDKVIVGNETEAATLKVNECSLGGDGDATITINLGSVMTVLTNPSTIGPDQSRLKIYDTGDSYIDLVGGTLKVMSGSDAARYNTLIKGNGVLGNWVLTSEVIDNVTYDVYNAAVTWISIAPLVSPVWFPDELNTVDATVTATLVNFRAAGTPAWSVVSEPEPIANPANIVSANALETDVTFTAKGVYTLKVEVTDGGMPHSGILEVTVYENGCLAAKGEDGYDEAAAREIGDTNYDCDVNELDLANMAFYWLLDGSTISL
jgi:hypothetical protein